MLTKYGSSFAVECDHCGDDFDTGEDEFLNAVHAMKKEGWIVSKKNGEWDHRCPDCQRAGPEEFEKVA